MVQIASFDIGIINFAWSITEVNEDVMRVIDFGVISIKENRQDKTITTAMIHNLFTFLETIRSLLSNVSVFLIEQQMNFGKQRNPRALCLSHILRGYLVEHYGYDSNEIIEFPSYHKTHELVHTKMNYRQRKQWSIDYIHEWKESTMTDPLKTKWNQLKKKDDVADTFVQMIAYIKRQSRML